MNRSWYKRAGVERVMDFCTPGEYLGFLRETPEFERMLARSGNRLYKILVLGQPRRTIAPLQIQAQRSAEALEAIAD